MSVTHEIGFFVIPDESPPTHSAKRNKTKPQRKTEEGAASKKSCVVTIPPSLFRPMPTYYYGMSPPFGDKNVAARMLEISRQ